MMSVLQNPALTSLGAKLVDARQALAAIKPGNRIYLGTGCAAPRGLIAALETLEGGPADLEYISFLTTLASPDKPSGPMTRYRHRSFFVGSDIRDLASTDRLEYVPISLEDVPALLANGRLPIDVALLQVSPPYERGFVSLGVSVDLAPAVLKVARHVIAEINSAMPRTHGTSFVHVDRFDAFVNVETPVTEYRHPPAGDTADRIARYIAAIIEATLFSDRPAARPAGEATPAKPDAEAKPAKATPKRKSRRSSAK